MLYEKRLGGQNDKNDPKETETQSVMSEEEEQYNIITEDFRSQTCRYQKGGRLIASLLSSSKKVIDVYIYRREPR